MWMSVFFPGFNSLSEFLKRIFINPLLENKYSGISLFGNEMIVCILISPKYSYVYTTTCTPLFSYLAFKSFASAFIWLRSSLNFVEPAKNTDTFCISKMFMPKRKDNKNMLTWANAEEMETSIT